MRKREICVAPLWVEEKKPRTPKPKPKTMTIYEVFEHFRCGDGEDIDSAYYTDRNDALKDFRKRVRYAKKERGDIDKEHKDITEKEDYFFLTNKADDWWWEIEAGERTVKVTGELPLLH